MRLRKGFTKDSDWNSLLQKFKFRSNLANFSRINEIVSQNVKKPCNQVIKRPHEDFVKRCMHLTKIGLRRRVRDLSKAKGLCSQLAAFTQTLQPINHWQTDRWERPVNITSKVEFRYLFSHVLI